MKRNDYTREGTHNAYRVTRNLITMRHESMRFDNNEI